MAAPLFFVVLLMRFFKSSGFSFSSASKQQYDYDVVIIGAGASGLFASGASSSLGLKTLLLDKAEGYLGGDCSNSACVPSKAIRSVAKLAHYQRTANAVLNNSTDESLEANNGHEWLTLARKHATDTVQAVRKREDPASVTDRNPKLQSKFVRSCSFVSPHKLEIQDQSSPKERQSVTFKSAIIATGASPTIPLPLARGAKTCGIPVTTYRTLLSPKGNSSIWNILGQSKNKPCLVVIGGGPTACELGQSLARLGGNDLNVTMIAPVLLPNEDESLQKAAFRILSNDGIGIMLGHKAVDVKESADSVVVVLDNGVQVPVDAMLVCTGRSPSEGLVDLGLDKANVAWTAEDGIVVCDSTLRSTTASNVYACGDCASVVHGASRTASHGAWTGFHASRNSAVPWILRIGSRSTHPIVPRVVYTDPQLASVGLSRQECEERPQGYDSLHVPEEGMDKADMERLERRNAYGFVELRVSKIGGKILGLSTCGSAAAELANEVAVAIQNNLTSRQVARAIHSYPSNGYHLHRIALGLAMNSNPLGALDILGPVAQAFASMIRQVWRLLRWPKMMILMKRRQRGAS